MQGSLLVLAFLESAAPAVLEVRASGRSSKSLTSVWSCFQTLGNAGELYTRTPKVLTKLGNLVGEREVLSRLARLRCCDTLLLPGNDVKLALLLLRLMLAL